MNCHMDLSLAEHKAYTLIENLSTRRRYALSSSPTNCVYRCVAFERRGTVRLVRGTTHKRVSTVRRIAAGAVDSLLHNESRSSTEHRHPIKIDVKGVIFLREHIIHVVAIRCEGKTPNHNFIWGQNLYVAAGGHLANIEALFFSILPESRPHSARPEKSQHWWHCRSA